MRIKSFLRLLDRMEDIQGMLARYKAEGASSETLEEVSELFTKLHIGLMMLGVGAKTHFHRLRSR